MDIKIQETIFKSIDILIQRKLEKLGYNYYVEGLITAVNSSNYDVLINGRTIKIKAREGLSLATNDIVLVCIVNGNFSNKFIDLKRV